MTELGIGEAGSVQYPMVAHAAAVGWEPVPPEVALRKRGGAAGVFFRDELERAIVRFNSWMSADSVRQVIERLEALPPTIEGNREMLGWLRGERQWYDEREERHRRVELMAFDAPESNALQVTWEWTQKPPARKENRADVMFLVNGVPVCIVEHKNPTDGHAIDRGVTQLRRYEVETPELIGAAQLFNVTHLLDYWYGVTWNVTRRNMARWKEREGESYRFAVQSFFEPTDFLRTLRDWILFYVEDGETRKSVLRQHQRIAVDRILERCEDPERRRGLIWHTQGSGKTFTLLTAARLILEDQPRFGTPTVLLVVDRTELEGQLKAWVERLLGEMKHLDIPVWHAGSKGEIEALLKADRRGLIVSMIHKFDGIERDANTREDIFVFIDEAHRSVAHDLGTYLMAAVPNATILGFTGTPIARTAQGEGTFKIFGADDPAGYLDRYSIRESIEDETTLPIRHTLAPSEMIVDVDRLDREFYELADAEGVTDVEELNRVLDRAVGLRTFLTADDRVRQVAGFVADHFRENVLPLGYKAFLVGVNREACAKYKIALDELLPTEWSVAIYTDNAADVVERPLVHQVQLSAEQQEDVLRRFKKPSEDPRILIVTDKLLTGFDAPPLYCMYLDKPMRDHVLLQAIARVNRPYVDAEGVRKRVGLVVDFVGVLRDLRKALQFDSADVSGVIEDLDLLLRDLLARLEAARAEYLEADGAASPDERLEALVYGRLLDPVQRQEFFESYKAIEALWEIVSPAPELRDLIPIYRRLAQLYATVRNAYSEPVGYVADLAYKTKRLVQESVMPYGLGQLTRTVTFDVATIEGLRAKEGSDEGKIFNLVRGLRQEFEEAPGASPVLQSLKDRAERIVRELEERRTDGLAAMDQLEALAKEKEDASRAAAESGLTPRGLGVFWSLKGDSRLAAAGISALDLARQAEDQLSRFPNAALNAEEQRRLRAALYQPLLGLEGEERGRIVDLELRSLLDGRADGGS